MKIFRNFFFVKCMQKIFHNKTTKNLCDLLFFKLSFKFSISVLILFFYVTFPNDFHSTLLFVSVHVFNASSCLFITAQKMCDNVFSILNVWCVFLSYSHKIYRFQLLSMFAFIPFFQSNKKKSMNQFKNAHTNKHTHTRLKT